MNNLCLKIENKDRVGLVLDVSDILSRQNINIVSMQVQPNVIYLEIPLLEHYQDIHSQLKTIPHVQEVQTIPFCPNPMTTLSPNSIEYESNQFINTFVSNNPQMQTLIQLANKAAKTQSTILLRGETGTGKELFAKTIHYSSSRQDKPFVPVNCAALPEALLESELFGYEDGAFTGAKRYGKKGIFEYAEGGTVFLDEIGELPFHLQAKLLRVLQESTIKRIGSNQEISIDVRIIAATNSPLEKMIIDKTFREDLFYRLNVIPLWLLPLRNRKEDLPILIEKIFAKKCQKQKLPIPKIATAAIKKLSQHNWPGNIRELENVLERAICFASSSIFNADDIVIDEQVSKSNSSETLAACHETLTDTSPKKLQQSLEELEFTILSQAIKDYGSSREVGKILGISHTAVLNRIKKYQI